ncbi:MAG: ABC transporter ATP-binding protein [Ignavibacteria bacterium]|nr:ABC transporter ATP-binding protein [Ignavibacteria bacterium]
MLKVTNLRKTFKNADGEVSDVINIPDFSLQENFQLAVSGKSGSGKSTFLNLIAGIISQDNGEIFFNDEKISSLSESKRDAFRSKNIGYVFQTFNLLQGFTAIENVMLGMMFANNQDRKKAEALLNKVGLAKKINNKPSELSVGEQQRVAIARAVANSPKLILADEPTANLDAKNGELAIDLIKNICEENKISLLLVSHETDIINKFENKINFEDINKAATQ